MSDSPFADQLFANLEQTLTGFELTTEEMASFKNLSREDLSKIAQALAEERKSFGWSNHNQTVLHIYNCSQGAIAFKKVWRATFDKFVQTSPEDRKSFGLGTSNHNETVI